MWQHRLSLSTGLSAAGILLALFSAAVPDGHRERVVAASAKPPVSAEMPRDERTAQHQNGASQQAPLFERDVLPILKAKCARCHNAKARKANLDLTSYAGVMKGGETGKIINTDEPKKSSLYEMIHEGYMPPDGENLPTEKEQALITEWIAGGARSSKASNTAEQITQKDVLPIMYLRCTVCHGRRRQEAGLDLRTKAAMLKGGKSGPAIVPGHPEKSLVLKRIHAKEMPPRKKLVDFGVRPMEAPEIDKLTRWIADGAPVVEVQPDVPTTEPDPLVTDEDREFWAFQPPKRPEVPEVRHQRLVRTPIDAFLLRKLESEGLTYSPPADRYTLIRRVAFDLTGLPPTWQDVQRFIHDDSPHAYERMVERYLASPRYGERWGQYWLDVAGYSDSEGKRSADVVRPFAWRYRDYVIRAFNNDKPYDRFLKEQIAGDELLDYTNMDELTPEAYDNLVASGFLRMAPDGTGSDIVNTVVERMEVVSDELNVLGAGVMGLTLKCAQCHTHKYDPIPQRDYYRMVAIFQGAFDVHDWLRGTTVRGQTKALAGSRVLKKASSAEMQQWQKEKEKVNEQIAAVKADLKRLRNSRTEHYVQRRLQDIPADLQGDVRKMLATPPKQRDAAQKQLAEKFENRLRIDEAELKRIDATYRKQSAQADKKIRKLKSQVPPQPAIRALWDRGTPSPTWMFRRGDPTNPGREVGPGVPSVLTDGRTPFEVKPPWPGAKKTGRRLAFAQWLTQPDHPLTARVMVNRVWYHHFGRGIVKSLGNFGKTGARPTHPELLDWLATEFVARNWSVKDLHRLIMFSSAYRQVSTTKARRSHPVESHGTRPVSVSKLDPENILISRMPLRRMEAEVVRDSILAVSGELDVTPFGKPDPVDARSDGLVTSKRGEHGWRRSIYVLHRRKEMPTILENFDLPQMIPNCIKRPTSTVSSQALHLMNNTMIRQLADSFAKRVRRDAGADAERQVERVYQIALSRPPTDEEKRLSLSTLKQLRAAWAKQLKTGNRNEAEHRALTNLCHTIINSAAFLYVD